MEQRKRGAGRLLEDVKKYGPTVLVMLALYLVVHGRGPAFCYLINFTGFPCAGCGMTRAFLCLLGGQPGRAFYLQPMIFPVCAFLLYCGFFRYVRGKKVPGFSRLLIALAVALLLFYGVRMYLYFPDRIPYVYRQDNLLARRFPGYGEMVRRLAGFLRTHRR